MNNQDETSITFGQLEKECPEKFDLWVPDNSPFGEPGFYTVNMPDGCGGSRYVNIKVRKDGGFSILNDTTIDFKTDGTAIGKNDNNPADEEKGQQDHNKNESLTVEKIKLLFKNM